MRRRFVLQRNTSPCIVVQGGVVIEKESKDSIREHALRAYIAKPRMVRNLEAQLKEYRDSKR